MRLSAWRICITSLLAAVHLAAVTCGALQLPVYSQPGMAGELVATYGAYSGAENSYGFFAPGVGPQIRVRFTVVDATGTEIQDRLDTAASREANLRLGGIGYQLGRFEGDTRDALLRSLAASMFGRHRLAQQVVVHVEVFGIEPGQRALDLPTMAEYVEGRRPHWIEVDRLVFTRIADAAKARS